MSYNYNKEVNEAIYAADVALSHLRAAQEYLNSARRWGIYDMVGGGFLSTVIKHSKMNNAEQKMRAAKESLMRFSRELRDVDRELNLSFNSGDFLSFADYFFDGMLANWLVQNRINEARAQVDSAIRKVENVRTELVRSIR